MNTATKERPILFSGEMVRAILAGRKTQTRRVIKSQPNFDWSPSVGFYCPVVVDRHGHDELGPELYGAADEDDGRKSPYGKPGERLWVRETFCVCDDDQKNGMWAGEHPDHIHRADWNGPDPQYEGFSKWKSPIHMPRWASRILLEITDIRVEQVQDISEADAEAEGVKPTSHPSEGHRESFAKLWNEINEKRGFAWYTNPWVWIIEFRRIKNGQS